MKTGPGAPTQTRSLSPPETTGLASAIDFHGASIINDFDEEIPITEAMVRQACKNYIQQWESTRVSRSSATPSDETDPAGVPINS